MIALATWRRLLALAAIDPDPRGPFGASGYVVQMSAGSHSSFAVTSTGQLYAFGEDLHLQLGVPRVGIASDIPVPQLVPLPAATGPVVDANAATYDSYAITASGQLFGFGSNRWGPTRDFHRPQHQPPGDLDVRRQRHGR